VRPLAIACTLFTAMKLGLFVGQNIGAGLKKGRRNLKRHDGNCQDGQTVEMQVGFHHQLQIFYLRKVLLLLLLGNLLMCGHKQDY
jgi:hypothetical protein